jgi:hypothetical protein
MLELLTKKFTEEISNGGKIPNRTLHLFPSIVKRYGNSNPELNRVYFDALG